MTIGLLVAPPPLGVLATALALALSVGALLAGLAPQRPGRSPSRAMAISLLILAVPVVLAVALLRDAASGSLLEAARSQSAAGTAGLVLALPVGLASGLWAGIASARRAFRAGERARLSAAAAGHVEAGQIAAAIVGRSTAPRLGALAGAVGAMLVVLPTSLGLLAAGHSLSEGATDMQGLGGSALYRSLLAADAGRLVTRGTQVSGAGALLLGAFLAALHIGSSRRRNAALALEALQQAGLRRPAIAAAISGLTASGKPGALVPLLLALLMLVLAAAALWGAGQLRERGAAPEDRLALVGELTPGWRGPAARTSARACR